MALHERIPHIVLVVLLVHGFAAAPMSSTPSIISGSVPAIQIAATDHSTFADNTYKTPSALAAVYSEVNPVTVATSISGAGVSFYPDSHISAKLHTDSVLTPVTAGSSDSPASSVDLVILASTINPLQDMPTEVDTSAEPIFRKTSSADATDTMTDPTLHTPTSLSLLSSPSQPESSSSLLLTSLEISTEGSTFLGGVVERQYPHTSSPEVQRYETSPPAPETGDQSSSTTVISSTSRPVIQSPQIVRIVYKVNGERDFQELNGFNISSGSEEGDINTSPAEMAVDKSDMHLNEIGDEEHVNQDDSTWSGLSKASGRIVPFARSSKSTILDKLQRWLPAIKQPSPVDTTQPFDPYKNWDSDSQEHEREMEERAREQSHSDYVEDTNTQEANHFVPEEVDAAENTAFDAERNVTGRWYLLLLAGNSTTVRLRQSDFAKYLKVNLAARLSVEYNDLRVNRVEFKPLLVNVTIFSRPKDPVGSEVKEEAPLHMLANTNATLLELSGEEYHVLGLITIPSPPEPSELQANNFDENRFESDSYTSSIVGDRLRPMDFGVAIYFAIAAGLVSVLLAVFIVGLCRYVRKITDEIQWPWTKYKPVLPKWSMPPKRRVWADHIARCSPLNVIYSGDFQAGESSGTTREAVWSEDQISVPVQKILAPEPPRKLVLNPEPGKAHLVPESPMVEDRGILDIQELPHVQPASKPEVLQDCPTQPTQRPNSKLNLFETPVTGVVVQPNRTQPRLHQTQPPKKRLQPQGRHPLDVRIARPTVLGLDNPNYMLQ